MRNLIRSLIRSLRDRFEVSIRENDGDYELYLSENIELRHNTDSNSNVETARTVHKEARNVLDHQITLLDDIDDKAARTVRITIVLVGAILGAASLEDSTGFSLGSNYIMWGTAYLIFSIALGMKTYNVSEPFLGPNSRDLRSLLSETSDEEDMLTFLINDGYTTWISETEFLNRVNGWYLDLTQWSLVIGISLLAMGLLNQRLSREQAPMLKSTLIKFNDNMILGIPFVIILCLTVITIGYSVYHVRYRAP